MKKINILNKCIGNTYAIIEDLSKTDFYYGKVLSVIDENHVKIEDDSKIVKNINIFHLRNPKQEI